MPTRIREETNDLIILDDDPKQNSKQNSKQNRSAIIWGGVFVLFSIIAWIYYPDFLLLTILGAIICLSNFNFSDVIVTVDKKIPI